MKLAILLILALIIVTGCSTPTNDNSSQATCDLEDSCVDGNIKIPISEVSSSVKKFHYESGDTVITYFAVLGSDGEVRTALDACDVCGGYQDYTQVGNDIKCNKCGRVFSINGLGTKNKGYGCWPSHLTHTIDGNDILINANELDDNKYRFA